MLAFAIGLSNGVGVNLQVSTQKVVLAFDKSTTSYWSSTSDEDIETLLLDSICAKDRDLVRTRIKQAIQDNNI